MTTKNLFYNAQHAPIGAFSSFTLEFKGKSGGLGIELRKPADQNIYIEFESKDGQRYETLPFFEQVANTSARYDIEKTEEPSDEMQKPAPASQKVLKAFHDSETNRTLEAAMDTWHAGDLAFLIYSPVRFVPDPSTSSEEALKAALVPAVFAELTFDKRQGTRSRRGFFEYEAADAAHVSWLLHPELSYWCWSDQILSGLIGGSKYYPRGVTAIWWLYEGTGNRSLIGQNGGLRV